MIASKLLIIHQKDCYQLKSANPPSSVEPAKIVNKSAAIKNETPCARWWLIKHFMPNIQMTSEIFNSLPWRCTAPRTWIINEIFWAACDPLHEAILTILGSMERSAWNFRSVHWMVIILSVCSLFAGNYAWRCSFSHGILNNYGLWGEKLQNFFISAMWNGGHQLNMNGYCL